MSMLQKGPAHSLYISQARGWTLQVVLTATCRVQVGQNQPDRREVKVGVGSSKRHLNISVFVGGLPTPLLQTLTLLLPEYKHTKNRSQSCR